MATKGNTASTSQGRPRRVGALAAATFVVISAFTATAALISLFGSAEDGAPGFTMIMTPGEPAHAGIAGLQSVGDGSDIRGGLPNDPISAFAAPVPDTNGRIRIAILVTGLGMSPRASKAAIERLPVATTVSFSPYARDAQVLADAARRRGLEVLLETSLEPFDYPNNDPGPYTILMGLTPAENEARLDWLLGRLSGYPGVVAVVGAKFLSSPDISRSYFEMLQRRGLYFVDAASTTPALVLRNADEVGVPAIARAIQLDTLVDADVIDTALSNLAAHAEAESTALGVTALYPVAIDRIVVWSQTLEARGLVLVPVSALARPAIN